MAKEFRYEDQFQLKQDYYLNHLDFANWHRYFFIIKEILSDLSGAVLEVGSGSDIVKNCLQPLVKDYKVLDINPKLNPDIVADVREHQLELESKFNWIIIADVLEHIPFSDLGTALKNLSSYLRLNGKMLVTIPPRQSHFLLVTPLSYKPYVITIPTGFLSPKAFYRRFIQKKIWIDPAHCWEIGDGNIKRSDVESLFQQTGLSLIKFN